MQEFSATWRKLIREPTFSYRGIGDLNRAILSGLQKIPRDIELVVGVPRSGLLAANILALYLNLPVADPDGFINGRILTAGERGRKHHLEPLHSRRRNVLVIDDSILSGAQMHRVREQIGLAKLPHTCIYAAVYAAPNAVKSVDIYFEVVDTPRVFQWNVMHHEILTASCLDIDGLLCRDPAEHENDDGREYEKFLASAEPLFIPSTPVGWLVSCRLEKYRGLTEEWLARHGVKYGQLVLMNLPSKAERVRSGRHAAFKSEVYLGTRASLFIESSRWQAREIARRTLRPVLCTENWELEGLPPEKYFEKLVRGAFRRSKRHIASFASRLRR